MVPISIARRLSDAAEQENQKLALLRRVDLAICESARSGQYTTGLYLGLETPTLLREVVERLTEARYVAHMDGCHLHISWEE